MPRPLEFPTLKAYRKSLSLTRSTWTATKCTARRCCDAFLVRVGQQKYRLAGRELADLRLVDLLWVGETTTFERLAMDSMFR